MPVEPPESKIFALLAKRRRRRLLRALEAADPPLRASELAELIAERADADATQDDRRQIYISIHHNHLPRLEAADVVAYDEETETVEPDLHFERLVRVLDEADERDLPWSDG